MNKLVFFNEENNRLFTEEIEIINNKLWRVQLKYKKER